MICQKCQVEVIQSKVRKYRIGHVKLDTPIAHIWFRKILPYRINIILNLPSEELEKVLYFQQWIVLDPKDTALKKMDFLSEERYAEIKMMYGSEAFIAGMGAESIKRLLDEINLDILADELKSKIEDTTSKILRQGLSERLESIKSLIKLGIRPERMILSVLPIIPPYLRPQIVLSNNEVLDTENLNDFYSQIIKKNNLLKRLRESNAPELITRDEKRMLQKLIDALFESNMWGKDPSDYDKARQDFDRVNEIDPENWA